MVGVTQHKFANKCTYIINILSNKIFIDANEAKYSKMKLAY